MRGILFSRMAASAVVLIPLVLGGCYSTGSTALRNETSTTISQKLHKGMHQDRVKSIFGSPNGSSVESDGTEIWVYHFSQGDPKLINFIPYVNLVAGGADVKERYLEIRFGKDKRVRSFRTFSAQNELRTGIIR